VRRGFENLKTHVDYALAHDHAPEKAKVFPTGEAGLEPFTRSVQAVLAVGCNNSDIANIYLNSKTCFVTYKPVPLPATATNRRALQFYTPNATGGDSSYPGGPILVSKGIAGYTGFTNNPSGASSFVAKSRGVFTHITLAFQGQLSTATGSLYIHIPEDGLYNTKTLQEVGHMTFESVFGESDNSVPISNTNGSHARSKKFTITLAKLAELGSISFVIYNENVIDYVLQRSVDLPEDTLSEDTNNSTRTESVNFMCWCDSTTATDRVRVQVSHHFDVLWNSSATSFGFSSRGAAPHLPPDHLAHLPEIINSTHFVIPPTDVGATMRQVHAHAQVASMAGEQMQIGTLSTEEEMDVGHPSFGSVKKALKAAWNTEQTDNEYYGAVVAGQPEVAAYAAPVVEPAIAAHAIYNFFRTNK